MTTCLKCGLDGDTLLGPVWRPGQDCPNPACPFKPHPVANDNVHGGEKIRQAVSKALVDWPSKNPNMLPCDRFLALLYIAGFKVVPVPENEGKSS